MSTIDFTQDGDLGIATIANPPLNLVDPSMVDALEALVVRLEGLPLRAVLVRAAGEHFCAGADVAAMFQNRSAADARALLGRFMALLPRFERLPYPSVAAVQGLCLAAGLELVLACDVAVAARSAQMGFVEAVIGATPFGGGAQRLAARVGPARAREMVFTAGVYDAKTLEHWHVVNRLVDDADLEPKSLALARQLAAGPTRAHAVTKQLIQAHVDGGVSAADERIPELAPALFETRDMQHGIESLLANGPGKATFEGR